MQADDQPTRSRFVRSVDTAAALGRWAAVRGVEQFARGLSTRPPLRSGRLPRATGRPLIIVGGYGSSPELYQLFARSFATAGIDAVHVVPLIENAFSDIHQNAELVSHYISGLGSDVDIVAHSEGGLISRAYLKFHGGTQRVRHLVTIGTPHRGLPPTFRTLPAGAEEAVRRAREVAHRHLGSLWEQVASTAIRQMLEGSEFMTALNDTPATPGPTTYCAIASRHDGIIPFAAASLPDADNVANVTINEGWARGNHAAITTTNGTVFRAALQFLHH